MASWDEIRALERKVELLAPVGKPETLQAVLDAGADAVYLGTKQFNMRRHRGDFNFTESQLTDAVKLAHDRGRRVHVTVNVMLGESELPAVRDLLGTLDTSGVDAIIVNDLAVLQLARALGVRAALHASTMMNVHHAEQARVLKSLGVSRIIASRDISLREIGEIGRAADVETECFAHGDMCVCQSGQCSLSGLVFGKSANRGECMKPCRWTYELVRLDDGSVVEGINRGHLLAIKDLCLIRHIPEAIQAGICSLKIEGRMRDAGYLAYLIAAYRRAIDAYYADPTSSAAAAEALDDIHRVQVRGLSTLVMVGGASHREQFDVSGQREPLFLSDGGVEADIAEQEALLERIALAPGTIAAHVDLAVTVDGCESAEAALQEGANRIYIAAEHVPGRNGSRALDWLEGLVERARAAGVGVSVRTPRITTDRTWAATRWLLQRLSDIPIEGVLVHHLGTLRLARQVCPKARIMGDYGFNVLNSLSVRCLADLGMAEVTIAGEAGYEELVQLAARSPLPLQVQAHGALVGMVLEHCVIALYASASGRADVCRGPCRHVGFALRDQYGQVRPVMPDQDCRNHLLTARDLATLPALRGLLLPGVACVRIEAQFYAPQWVAFLARAYRTGLDALTAGHDGSGPARLMWPEMLARSPRPLGLGPYGRSVIRSRSTAEVMAALADERRKSAPPQRGDLQLNRRDGDVRQASRAK